MYRAICFMGRNVLMQDCRPMQMAETLLKIPIFRTLQRVFCLLGANTPKWRRLVHMQATLAISALSELPHQDS
jgi:hypothetical protein